MDLVFALGEGYDAAVFVDAVPRGEQPGRVFLIEPELDAADGPVTLDAHGMDPVKVLALARQLGPVPERILVVGCEPLVVDVGRRGGPRRRSERARARRGRRRRGAGRVAARRAAANANRKEEVMIKAVAGDRCWRWPVGAVKLVAGAAGHPQVPEDLDDVGGRMHRTKVRVVEDALDANNTIARANRDDFDRDARDGRELHERARARARRRCSSARCATLDGVRVGVLEGDVEGSMDADRLASLHVPVTQLNTDRGLRRRVPPRREHGALGAPGAAARRHRPARDRERRQPRLPGGVQGRRGRARDGLLGHRGRGQAAQVPADVPRVRPGRW